jgi:3-oxoacyl-[acyl-carrier-protein] synthase-1
VNGEPIYVVALGASTAVGRDAWSSAAAVRAGISGFTQHPYMIDTAGEPMRAAIAPWLDIGLSGTERFGALLLPAIDQALIPVAETQAGPLRIALSLGLPCPRPGLPGDLQSVLVKTLSEKYRHIFSAVAAFPNGHAAGLLALDAAVKKLVEGAFDACVVAGVDSYIEPETLEWLEESDQLHSAGPLNNAWGFIPGEGAGALLLMRGEVAQRLRFTPLARVLGVGTAFEPKRIKTETVCIGEGLTQAFRGALAALPGGIKVTDVYCDMNGEPYRADEYGFTCLRTKEAFESPSDFIAPADCWGDVAAAGAPLHLMLAAIAGAKGYANGNVAFAWASAEGGERSAALMALGGGA